MGETVGKDKGNIRNDNGTDLFLALTPEKVLDAVEQAGLRCNPICYPLNSFENRVYEVELEDSSRIVAKFYRPNRWSEEQILEEHAFMSQLDAAEIPICGVKTFPNGKTLKRMDNIYYCLYDRFGGRAPEELDDEMVERLGMLAARMHNVGAAGTAHHRLRINADTYVRENLSWLIDHGALPADLADRYARAAESLAAITDELMEGVAIQRIHGDFHTGNLLLHQERLHVLDFDDMVVGPPVQDLWLLLPGRDTHTQRQRQIFIEAYEQFRMFDRATLRLVEPLRGLRMVHYCAWLARRWHDPIFPLTWPHFGTEEYWREETDDLEDLLALIRKEMHRSSPDGLSDDADASTTDAEKELTNKDFFWDWEDK